MKRYKKIVLLLCLPFVAGGCSDKFFDLQPNDKVTTDKVYKTAKNFNMAIIGCYAKLQGQVMINYEMCEFRSDNIYLNAPTTGTQDRYDIDQFQDKASNGIVSDAWANFNNNVYRCNLVLDKIDGADFAEKLKNQYKAEALFVRAMTYFNMYRLWGGVPLTRKVVSVEEASKIGRATNEQMYDYIAGDLKEIIDNNMLPVSYSNTDAGRATIGAARALLGKVYLTFGKWAEARDVLAQVVDLYSLVAINDIFDVNKKLNPEIIFAVCYNKSIVGEGHGFWYSIANLTDNNMQTKNFLDCFSEAGDKRKELVTYVKVAGEKSVCVMNKFYDTRDATTQNVGNDNVILRYADVLLMYAEALNEVGYSNDPTSPAIGAINQVRKRAGLQDIDVAGLSNSNLFREAILLERQRELPYEGHRWFDLVRMGAAVKAMAANGHTIQSYQLLFPIPKSELERVNNTELLWQNNGY